MTTKLIEDPSPKTWLDRLSRALAGEPKDRAELKEMLRDASKRDLLTQEALGMMEGALQITEKQVRDIMIPRAQMMVLEHDMAFNEILNRIIEGGFSRYPVIEEGKDEIVGILIAKDLLKYAFEPQRTFRIQDVIRKAFFVPESKCLNDLLKEFRYGHQHMAIVINEYGGVAGIATIEDVLEIIVGDIEDEHDQVEKENIQRSSNRRFSIQATTPIEEFNEYFGTHFKLEEIDTMGGLVAKNFGYVPKKGEKIHIDGCKFTVVHADNRRIRLLKILLDKPLT